MTSPSEIVDMAKKLMQVAARWKAARANLFSAQSGFPELRGGPGGGGAGEHSTIVERLALAAVVGRGDEASAALSELDSTVRRISRSIDVAWDIVTTWSRTPDRPAPVTPDKAPEGWCVSCYDDDHTHRVADLARYSEPPLCKSCGDHYGALGEFPPMEFLRIRHAGGRATARALRRERQVMKRLGIPSNHTPEDMRRTPAAAQETSGW